MLRRDLACFFPLRLAEGGVAARGEDEWAIVGLKDEENMTLAKRAWAQDVPTAARKPLKTHIPAIIVGGGDSATKWTVYPSQIAYFYTSPY
jgi:hypothetical protein